MLGHCGQPGTADYVANGREYVVMAFGGCYSARKHAPNQTSAVGDALIAFALPRDGHQQPKIVTASPIPVPLTPLPENAMPIVSSPPRHAHQIEMHARYLHYFPDHFQVTAGEEVVIHLKNEGIAPLGFIIGLADQILVTQQPIHPGDESYLLFNAPTQPGDYQFHDVSPMATYARMTGTMHVIGKRSSGNGG